MRRRLWIILVALLVLVSVGDFIAWHAAENQLRAGLDAWIAARRAGGWSVASTAPQAGGWPLAATLTLSNAVLQGGEPAIPGGLTWRAEHVVLRLDVFHPLALRIEAEGAQQVRVAASPQIRFGATSLAMIVPLPADPAAPAVHLHGEGVRASIPVNGKDDALTLDHLDVDAVVHPEATQGQGAISLALLADGIGLPAQLNWTLGPRIAQVALDGALNGPLPDVAGLTAAATRWRDDGGSLEVQRLQTQWGPLGLTGTATLALDPELQPMGTGTAQVTGYAQTLDALARGGLMSRSAATTAKAVLSLLASAPDDSGPSTVEVPLSLQYRTLSMRQVPLVRLPELDWPPP
jgi:hypothetical protein